MNQQPIEVIASVTKTPTYSPEAAKVLMRRLNLNEKSFALTMNMSPMTVRLWTAGAARPCNLSRRLMQIYERSPEVINIISEQEDSE